MHMDRGSINSKHAHLLPGHFLDICHFFWKSCFCPTVGPGGSYKNPTVGLKIVRKCPTLRTIIFQRENLTFLTVSFTQCTFFSPKSLFSFADLFAVRYWWVVCNEDKCCVVTQHAADIRVAWLVYGCAYCVPMATLNQNK